MSPRSPHRTIWRTFSISRSRSRTRFSRSCGEHFNQKHVLPGRKTVKILGNNGGEPLFNTTCGVVNTFLNIHYEKNRVAGCSVVWVAFFGSITISGEVLFLRCGLMQATIPLWISAIFSPLSSVSMLKMKILTCLMSQKMTLTILLN